MNGEYFNNEPPPGILNDFNNNETSLDYYNLRENERPMFSSYISSTEKLKYLPKTLREHIIIEYTATFAILESDIVEFYLKLDNDLLIKFPFLHVDHPLHEYYEYIKTNTKKRIVNVCPDVISEPLKDLLLYVQKLEKEKIVKNETKTKLLEEKQANALKEAKDKTQKLKQKGDQSYSSLFLKYMESDEESFEKDNTKTS
ncbi:conserved Plasmodium protein, unknown function [Plasmodium vinckei vinckei]|uniref:SURP motif domain-containing protein n=1 Tax=Plasmodium vinckei vinckei TaxID=54757 RepID=A0A449BV51_PLAVN|nr:conserved Plasmodium protein, unknown function [Plasmodium vinckei vinckei]KEG02647.1 hypothetical protein YYE_02476 [Plasmodium vinckei vinckei]VEV57357.1 conserved Plasmodium protein, unknown function [Plasmodium vinckei vinckei]